jgi:hypothetical protein
MRELGPYMLCHQPRATVRETEGTMCRKLTVSKL